MNHIPVVASYSQWVKATFVGWFLGIVFILLLSGVFDGIGLEGFQFYIGLGAGGGVGLVQAWVLRINGKLNGAWLLTSVGGMGIPFALVDVLTHLGNFSLGSYYIPGCISLGSLLISFWQYTYLKKFSTHGWHWLWVSSLGWICAAITVFSIDYTHLISKNNLVLFGLNLTLIFAGGLVLGLVTGKFLMRIVPKPGE
ncbi:MAG: hypothetical protein KF687_03465 [Cyclobacteriaceae bacterium]|nr:hypothetical protein [Cyclobacteriaceae bacterium]